MNAMDFPGGQVVKNLLVHAADMGSIPGLGRFPRQVSRGSAADYEADEQTGVSRLSWRLSSR